MPQPPRTDGRRLDEYIRNSDRAAELRALVKDAAERLVNDLTPLPPDVTDYVPAELAAVGERDDSPRPWDEEDEWLPRRNRHSSAG